MPPFAHRARSQSMSYLTARVVFSAFTACILSGCAASGGDRDESSDDSAIGKTTQALGTDTTLYAERTLATPWQSWSWSSVVTLANADAPRIAGSASQIKFTIQTAWGAL